MRTLSNVGATISLERPCAGLIAGLIAELEELEEAPTGCYQAKSVCGAKN